MGMWALIAAAGSGKRFGGKKQFLLLGGRPLFLHSVETFEALPETEGIVVVVPETDLKEAEAILSRRHRRLPTRVVSGGQTRQDSVGLGLESIPACEFVAVHDAARPLVSGVLIRRVLAGARETGACLPALPVSDTLKRAGKKLRIEETVSRESLWQAQTPQIFRHEILRAAFEATRRDRFQGTDESSLVERMGVAVQLVEGERGNMKITAPDDLKAAERILA